MNYLDATVALARLGRWKKYADRPNLVRALVIADASYQELFNNQKQATPETIRWPHQLALGVRGMPKYENYTLATEYLNDLRAAGVPFVWSTKRPGCIDVLDGRAATEEQMRRALAAYEYAEGSERERLAARMVALDAELGA